MNNLIAGCRLWAGSGILHKRWQPDFRCICESGHLVGYLGGRLPASKLTHDHDKGTPNDKQRVRYVERAMAFRILSLSGDGYMGLYTAAVLAGLEEQCGDSLYMKFDRVDACPVLIRISLD